MDDERLLTVKEAARVLHYSPRTIYRRAADGELRVLRLGSGPKATIRIDPQDLAAFVARSSDARV